jgi:hypothetical protein
MSETKRKYLAVDLDGTLARFECDWPTDYKSIGEPIPAMVKRVKKWIADGEDVRIFTARMDCYHPVLGKVPAEDVRKPIEDWCLKHLGKVLPITNRKDYWMKALYDDRAYHVETNTGRLMEEHNG